MIIPGKRRRNQSTLRVRTRLHDARGAFLRVLGAEYPGWTITIIRTISKLQELVSAVVHIPQWARVDLHEEEGRVNRCKLQ